MSRQGKNPPRKPASKFAHLRKKLQKAKLGARQSQQGKRPPLKNP